MANIDWMLVVTLVGPLLAVGLGAWINHIAEGRPRLLTYFVHSSAIATRNPSGGQPLVVHTHSIVVRNTSRKPAKNVRLGHHSLPDFTIFPSIQYSVEILPNETKEIVIPTLVRSEQITISYLYFPPLTWDKVNAYTKSDEGFAKVVPVQPVTLPPKVLLVISSAFTVVGFATALYLAAQLVRRWL